MEPLRETVGPVLDKLQDFALEIHRLSSKAFSDVYEGCVPPTNLLEAIELCVKIYQNRYDELVEQRADLEECFRLVEKLEHEAQEVRAQITEAAPELRDRADESAALIVQLSAQQHAIDEAEDTLNFELTAGKESEAHARRLQLQVQGQARSMIQPVKQALRAMRDLRPDDWKNLAYTLSRPSCPWTMRALVEAVSALLSQSPVIKRKLAHSVNASNVPQLIPGQTLGALARVGTMDIICHSLEQGAISLIDAAMKLELDEVPPHVLDSLAPTIASPNITIPAMSKHSKGAEALCSWLHCAYSYACETGRFSHAYRQVLCAHADVKASKVVRAEIEASLEQEELRLHRLRHKCEESSQKRAELSKLREQWLRRLSDLEAKLEAGELKRDDWNRRIARLRRERDELPGSLLLLYVYITCAMPLPLRRRRQLLKEFYECAADKAVPLPDPCVSTDLIDDIFGADASDASENGLSSYQPSRDDISGPSSSMVSLLRVCFGTQFAMQYIHADSLPSEEATREATLAWSISSRWRWPLVLDPELVMRRWLQGSHSQEIRVAFLSQPGWIDIAVECVAASNPTESLLRMMLLSAQSSFACVSGVSKKAFFLCSVA